MALTDFLFQGNPPPSVTSANTSTTSMPSWYQSYMLGLLNSANSVASQPYQPYTGPLVAPLSPLQQQATSLGASNVGNYSPLMNAASGLATSTSQGNAPMFNSGTLGNFMNPYTSDVVNQIGTLGQRQFEEDTLPTVMDPFTGAGQFGSSRNEEFAARAARDAGLNTQMAQSQALQSGYQNAMTNYGTFSGLGLQGASTLGGLGQTTQTLGQNDVSTLNSLGTQQQQQTQNNYNAAYNQFAEQRGWPASMTSFMQNIIQGLPSAGSTTSASTTAPYSGNSMSPSPLAQVAGTALLGKGLGVFARGGPVRMARGGSFTPSPLRLIGHRLPLLREVADGGSINSPEMNTIGGSTPVMLQDLIGKGTLGGVQEQNYINSLDSSDYGPAASALEALINKMAA